MSHVDEVRAGFARAHSAVRWSCGFLFTLACLSGLAHAQTLTLSAPATVEAAASFDYSIALDNDTGGELASVVVITTLPALVDYLGSTATGWDCVEQAGSPVEIECQAQGNLTEGVSSFTLQAAAGAPAVDTLVSASARVEVAAVEQGDDSADTTIEAIAELGIDKALVDGADRVDTLSVRGGDALSFAVVVDNLGPSPAQGLQIRDPLPAGFTSDPAQTDFGDPEWSCSTSAGPNPVVTCDYALTVAAGESAPELLIDVISPEVAGVFSNQVTGQSDADDAPFPHSSNSVSIEVFLEADLRVVKQPASASVYSGDPLTYTYTITNHGPNPASEITLVDLFDRADALGGLVITTGDADWTCQPAVPAPADASRLECAYNPALTLAGDGVTELVLSVTVDAPAVDDPLVLANQAEVNSAEALPDPASNISAVIEVDILPSADLRLSPRVPPAGDLAADSIFDYQIEVSNDGPSLAVELLVVDQVPEGALLRSASGTDWSCQINQLEGKLYCTRATLASSATSTINVSTRLPRNPPIAGQQTGSISSGVASVSANTHDPDLTNNSAAAFAVSVAAAWSLSVEKTASQAIVVPGQSFTYDITVENTGPSDLRGDIRPLLSDVFDSNLRGSQTLCGPSATVPCWSCEALPRPDLRQTLDTDVVGLTGLSGSQSLVVGPERRYVYTAGRFDNATAVFDRQITRNASFGNLSYNVFSDQVSQPGALAVHPGGAWLLTAEAGASARIFIQPRNPATGVPGAATELASGLDQPADLVFSRSGEVLFVAESGADAIRIFSFDAVAGTLSPVGQVARDTSGSNPLRLAGVRRLALSSDQQFLYAAAPGDNALVGFSVSAIDGDLTPLATASLTPEVAGQSVPLAALAVRAQGDQLYAAGGNRVLIFERNDADGSLGAFSATTATSLPARLLTGISGLVAAPDGDSFYVSAAQDGAVSIFSRDDLGNMVFLRSVALEVGMQANGLAMDSSGESLYVLASSDAVGGPGEPDRSQILTFSLAPDPQCDDLRLGDQDAGNLDEVPLTLPAGQRLVVVVGAGVNAGLPSQTIDNIASLEDVDGAVLTDNAEIDVRNATDIVVTKTAPDERPIPGTSFAYTIEIANNGPGGVSSAKVTDLPPIFGPEDAGFIASTVEWQCSAVGNACCNAGGSPSQCGQIQPTPFVSGGLNQHQVDLAAESALIFTLRGTLHPASSPNGILINEASIELPSGIEPFDPDNLASEHQIAIDARLDLWVVKERLDVSEQGGQKQVEYRLRVGNNGPSAAAGLTVSDLLDDPSFDADAATWSCSITHAGSATLADSCCDFGLGACQAVDLNNQTGPLSQTMALAPNARAEFLITVPVDDPGAAVVSNTANVGAPPNVTDIDGTNNQATLDVRLSATADLAIDKQILAGANVTPGEQVSFLVTLTNELGPDDVPVVVQDLLPPELDNVTWTCDATTPIPGDLSYDTHEGLGGQLVEPTAVLSSADGRHVYILAAGGAFTADAEPSPASLAVYERNVVPGPNFGELSLIDLEFDGVNDEDDAGLAVEGLAGARAMAFSPDQRHLYVAAGAPGAVVVFRRDSLAGSPQFGELTFVEARLNGSDQPADLVTPVSGLAGASDVRVSADGAHVYVVSRDDSAIAIFQREASTGTLAFQGKLSAPSLLAQGSFALWGAFSVQMPPEDDFVYVIGGGPTASFSGSSWATTDTEAAEGDRSYYVANTAGIDLKWLQQEQPVTVNSSADLKLSFQHLHSLDWATSCFDVGVLEISTDGGQNWADVLDAGGVFIQGGYNDTQNGAESNPLDSRPGWCRDSSGWPTRSF
jgi:uncharacterized repeat protein (TIGR01451 family)